MESSTPMESHASSSESPPAPAALTPFSRIVAVFARPASAWVGLDRRAQWWIPMLIVTLVATAMAAGLHHRAVVPMLSAAWREQVAEGQMTAEQVERMEQFFGGPTGLMLSVGQQFLVVPIITLLTALIVWFGVAFILGRPLRFRLSLETAAWSGLITLPSQVVTFLLAWSRETMRGIHVGWGAVLPEPESPSRVLIGLGIVLDALGPLSLWYVGVLVLGAATLSEAPRKAVAWVLGSLYLALVLLFASLGALLAPIS